ncbi:uncharacterized protein AAEQ78_017761 isoform 2-T2 [Lycaon pictus]
MAPMYLSCLRQSPERGDREEEEVGPSKAVFSSQARKLSFQCTTPQIGRMSKRFHLPSFPPFHPVPRSRYGGVHLLADPGTAFDNWPTSIIQGVASTDEKQHSLSTTISHSLFCWCIKWLDTGGREFLGKKLFMKKLLGKAPCLRSAGPAREPIFFQDV